MTAHDVSGVTSILRSAHVEGRLIPFLGAGFSIPLGLPSWWQLTEWMGTELGFDKDLFHIHGLAPQLAGFYTLQHPDGIRGFVAKMKASFHDDVIEERRKRSRQHQALALCRFRTIYTTNYERHVERALNDAGRRSITRARLVDFQHPADDDVCEVIKFHGDLEHPETLVLSEDHYFDRFRLEAAPDQRLRADMLGNIFLFIGYSFSDTNIRYIWHRMSHMRKRARAEVPEDFHDLRCYWATFGGGAVQPRLLDEWNIDVIELDPGDKAKSVADLLTALHG